MGGFFDVIPDQKSELEDFSAGYEGTIKLRGYKNGRVVALKSVTHFDGIRYFRKKAFALEIVYPGRVFSHICGVDDDTGNLRIIEKDFPFTRHSLEKCSLTLFHLKTPAADSLPSSSVSRLSSPASQPSSTQIPSIHPLPQIDLRQHSDDRSSTDYEDDGFSTDDEREQYDDGYGV